MKLYALIGSTAFAVNDIFELNEIIKDTEQDVLVFNGIVTWEGEQYTPMGQEISEVMEEW